MVHTPRHSTHASSLGARSGFNCSTSSCSNESSPSSSLDRRSQCKIRGQTTKQEEGAPQMLQESRHQLSSTIYVVLRLHFSILIRLKHNLLWQVLSQVQTLSESHQAPQMQWAPIFMPSQTNFKLNIYYARLVVAQKPSRVLEVAADKTIAWDKYKEDVFVFCFFLSNPTPFDLTSHQSFCNWILPHADSVTHTSAGTEICIQFNTVHLYSRVEQNAARSSTTIMSATKEGEYGGNWQASAR